MAGRITVSPQLSLGMYKMNVIVSFLTLTLSEVLRGPPLMDWRRRQFHPIEHQIQESVLV